MVKANFFYVFVGIESPSKESLAEAKNFKMCGVIRWIAFASSRAKVFG